MLPRDNKASLSIGFTAFLFVCFRFSHVTNAESDQANRARDMQELFKRRIEAPNATYILDNLFMGYDKRIRPHYREKPVEISLDVVVDSFHDIREEQMEYKVDIVLKESWKDPRLAYGNKTWFLRMKGDALKKMWLPDTVIENTRKLDVDEKTKTAYVFGDGTIFYSEWIKATLTSHMDFRKYPMDIQTLRIQIAAYSYDDTQVHYHWTKVVLIEKDMTEFYVERKSLSTELTSYVTGSHSAAVVEFEVRRRLEHFIVEFYLPCIVCTFASWLQFWMEQTDIGSRAGLGITTVLTEIFLLEFSNQGMPKVSYMKAAELFVVVSFGFIFLALVESALVYKATGWNKKIQDSKIPQRLTRNENQSLGVQNAVLLKSPQKPSSCKFNPVVYRQDEAKSSECILPGDERVEEDHPPDPASSSPSGYVHETNWGGRIDRGARLLFPTLYCSFAVTYFVFILIH